MERALRLARARLRSARSSVAVVALFMATVAGIEWPVCVILHMADAMLPGLGPITSNAFGFRIAIAFGWLGVAWMSLAHLIRSIRWGAVLQGLACGAFVVAFAVTVWESDDVIITVVSGLPFIAAVLFKVSRIAMVFVEVRDSDTGFSLMELLLFVSSWCAFFVSFVLSAR
jgi:hypothetical protein